MSEKADNQENSSILLYQTEDGKTRIDVRLEEETVWLTLNMMADLYQSSKQNISHHVRSIYSEGELSPEATVKKYLTVQTEGTREVRRSLEFYNLDMIISVGYRVKSSIATKFRIWATQRLKEYIVKGFAMDDERLKEGTTFGGDYFDELLERIRDIRASEKRFYKKITDIYALSADYDKNAVPTQEFFATVQNKLHWAIHGHTAAELIAKRADSSKPNMGLNTWKGAKVRKGDVGTAKNYLNQDEIEALNRIVTMYLDYAEDQAKRKQPMYMKDWRAKLDAFLQFNDREILDNPGKVSMDVAKQLAEGEYEKFHANRLLKADDEDDDFDEFAKRIEGGDK